MRRPLVSLACAAVAACGPATTTSSSSSSGNPGPLQVTIPFMAMVGSEPFACGQSYNGIGTTSATIEMKDARFYVHNVRLVNGDGADVPLTLDEDAWQHDGLALLDFENGTTSCNGGTADTNTSLRGTAPAGNYVGLKFTLGVPFEHNHQDQATAPAPLNLSSMFWTWNGGYKFLKMDFSSTGLPGGFNVHVGSTGCQPAGSNDVTSCDKPNRAEISLPDYELGHMGVQLDISALFAGTNADVNTDQTAPGCMSTPTDVDCAPIFSRLGLPFGGNSAGAQSVFSAQHTHN